ncbi:NUDIX domain-containing protein [Rhodobacteraceae bacterium 2CG4]|uniref:NUDIX domain-containing protein n=1 Tax=Halovulum marinum TaxID=2662447 RepID=A0A6L5YV47_9RHOB|nr:NUDIX hydrolase [Halovulum marinum]MSU88296.1 NUDIX domain-containing protein [Halovulum marinum]
MSAAPDPSAAAQPVRDAATIVLVRRTGDGPRVLMGQRGAGAVFMPGKFVFPGGRVDEADAGVALGRPLAQPEAARLATDSAAAPAALAAAAIRELWEEAGLRLAVRAPDGYAPAPEWGPFCDPGLAPDAAALRFFLRAVTPPGRPRRFDARFFLCEADALWGDPDDFAAAGDELSHLSWLPLDAARALETPFVTRIALGELQALLDTPGAERPVPFFEHGAGVSRFRAL